MSGICNVYEEKINACKILIVKPEGKGPLGRSKQRMEDGPNIETDLRSECADWIHLAQGSKEWLDVVDTTINFTCFTKGG